MPTAQELGVEPKQIREAAELLRQGHLVAFPTETVYGLGANALDFLAVSRIYWAKGRPRTSPLIVHVSSIEMARSLATTWPEQAQVLAERFWPGPLTLVVGKKPIIPDIVTAGLPTVGLRIPSHPVALALLQEAGIPIAAPSANRFGQLSPTTAEHVRRGLGRRVEYILDGGPCQVGIESTVIGLTGEKPVLLRPGGVSRSEIENLIGPVTLSGEAAEGAAHASPGQHPQHYRPQTPLLLVARGAIPESGNGAYLQLVSAPGHPAIIVMMPRNAPEYAARLYSTLHDLDAEGYDWIAVEAPPETPEWEGVLDRLRRASAR
jgi:L-threonylcarbamoyladenylate synthase